MEAPTGKCRTCRYCEARLFEFTAAPWDVDHVCVIRAEPKAPHASYCMRYEREPGTD